MLSPARRHMMRQQAIEAAQQQSNPLRHATGYEQMLVKLNDDKRRLKKVRSNERKAELKRQMLPDYQPWVAGVLSKGKAVQDAVLMTVMIWRLTAYLLAEEVASAATRAWTVNAPVDINPLLATLRMTESEDMPDQVRAKLHKITGYVLRDAGRADEALPHLTRALQLHEGCGVKKDIERLATAMKKQAAARR
ncbi:phage terminase small subunit [Mixta calida]|uniref:phage terminase small subunit n=1 Tax=Mixta calida TaxID=665913 RepID=UPI002911DAD3|nr:phage terminase small subunit [Mixta calida]MDU6414729.1 phage terminase small subunit [Mixta calida]